MSNYTRITVNTIKCILNLGAKCFIELNNDKIQFKVSLSCWRSLKSSHKIFILFELITLPHVVYIAKYGFIVVRLVIFKTVCLLRTSFTNCLQKVILNHFENAFEEITRFYVQLYEFKSYKCTSQPKYHTVNVFK